MKISEVVIGETYVLDLWAMGAGGIYQLEVTDIVTVPERGSRDHSRSVRRVRGIVRATTEGSRHQVGASAVVPARTLIRTAAESTKRQAKADASKARVTTAAAALSSLGLSARGVSGGVGMEECVIVERLSVEAALALAERLRRAQ